MNDIQFHKYLTFNVWKHVKWNFDWLALSKLAPECRKVCEVGIGSLDISILPWFAETDVQIIGVDPNPELAEAARRALPNAVIHERAIWADSCSEVTLYLDGGRSHVDGLWSPGKNGHRSIQVKTLAFSDIDDGSIDILNIDCEGGEWFVLSQLLSRPHLIGIELWDGYPNKNDCENWLISHGYRPLISSGPTGETWIFKRQG